MEPILTRPSPPFRHPAGFTLLEILIVVAIVLLMTTLTLPVINSVVTGHRIADTGARVAALIERARIHATVSHRIVGVRFFQGTNSAEFTAVALVEMIPNSDRTLATNTLSRPFHLPETLILSQAHSSLLGTNSSVGTGSASLSGSNPRPFRDFLIFPDGSTSLVNFPSNPHLAVLSRMDAKKTDGPANPFVLSIDPLTCRVTTHRK